MLLELQAQYYEFICFKDYEYSVNRVLNNQCVVLRHDIDRFPHNALKMAHLEYLLEIRGTYYFRIVPESFDVAIIEKIAELGHEIGYHYEDLDLVRGNSSKVIPVQRSLGEVGGDRFQVGGTEIRSQNQPVPSNQYSATSNPAYAKKQAPAGSQQPATDLIDFAMESFVKNLEKMRKIVDVKTICMHGSPLSPYDNRLLWTKYDYRDYGIIGEPYFDVDFSKVAYYTDTGRRWDGDSVSVRDKVVLGDRSQVKGDRSRRSINKPETTPSHLSPNTYHLFPKYRTTHEMIKAIEEGRFPQKVMLTVHPQRWHDRAMPWVRELVWQNVKNVGKRVLVRFR